MALRRRDNQPGPPACSGRKRGAQVNAIGRSRGGPSTKVHLIVDALGLPVMFEITEGQRGDVVVAPQLIERVRPNCLLGDKAYDTNAIRKQLAELDCTPVLASNENRVRRLPLDVELYKARAEIECTFNLLKQARRFATRYEKTLRNYAAVVALGCVLLWLRI
jgi:transposase